MLNNIFSKRKKRDTLLIMVGYELARRIKEDLDNNRGVITGLPSANQIEKEIEEIMRRMGV